MDELAPVMVETWDVGVVAQFVQTHFANAPQGTRAILCAARNTLARHAGAATIPWEQYRLIDSEHVPLGADVEGHDAALLPTELEVDTMLVPPIRHMDDRMADIIKDFDADTKDATMMNLCKESMFDPQGAPLLWGWLARVNPDRLLQLEMQRSVRCGWGHNYSITRQDGRWSMEVDQEAPTPEAAESRSNVHALAAHHYLMTLGDRSLNELHAYERGLLRIVLYNAFTYRLPGTMQTINTLAISNDQFTSIYAYRDFMIHAQRCMCISLDVEAYAQESDHDRRRIMMARAAERDADFVKQWYFILCSDPQASLALPTVDFPRAMRPHDLMTAYDAKDLPLRRLDAFVNVGAWSLDAPREWLAAAETKFKYQLAIDVGHVLKRTLAGFRMTEDMYAVASCYGKSIEFEQTPDGDATLHRWTHAHEPFRQLLQLTRRRHAVDVERISPVVAAVNDLMQCTGAFEYMAAFNRQTSSLLFAEHDEDDETLEKPRKRKRERDPIDFDYWIAGRDKWEDMARMPDPIPSRYEGELRSNGKAMESYFTPRANSGTLAARGCYRHGFLYMPTPKRRARFADGEIPTTVAVQLQPVRADRWALFDKKSMAKLHDAVPVGYIHTEWTERDNLVKVTCHAATKETCARIMESLDPARMAAGLRHGEICPSCNVKATVISSCPCTFMIPQNIATVSE